MKIEVAIKNLGYWLENKPVIPASKLRASTRLGKEALERVLAYKKAHRGLHYTPLPSETEE